MEVGPDQWERVKALFDAALGQEASQRAAFLREACPDDKLRQEVETLLRNHEQAGDFLRDSVLPAKAKKLLASKEVLRKNSKRDP